MTENLSSKKDVANKLLSEAASVFFHLDPRVDGVVVPQNFRKQPGLILEFGLNMAVPIRDLTVDDESLSGTLSFNRSPFWCKIPWQAVFAMISSDQRGIVFPDDVPVELQAQYLQQSPAPAPKPTPARSPLRVVGEESVDDAPKQDEQSSEEEQKPRAKPHLAEAPSKKESEQPEADAEESAEPPSDKPKERKLPSYLRVVK